MRIYKKIAALALSGVMTLGLMAGCSTTETETTPTTAPTVNQATSPTESEGASEANGLNAPITVISREEGSGTRGAFVEIMGVVDADEVDATVQTAEVVNSTAAMVTGTGLLTLAQETRKMRGGFVMLDNDVEINCTFETLVRLQREKLEKQVAQVLFPE